MKISRLLTIALTAISLPSFAASAPFPPLQSGEKIAFFGDSITNGGSYIYYLQSFLACYGVKLYNLGVSGDTSVSGLRRVDKVIPPLKPDRVCLIMGMNDGAFKPYETPEVTPAGRKAWEDYRKATDETIRKMQGYGVKVFISTPPAYNQYSYLPAKCLFDARYKNSVGIAGICKIDRELGEKYQIPVIGLNDALTKVYQKYPDVVFNPDRIHPNETAHVIMALELARGMGLPREVGIVSITGNQVTVQGAKVTDFKREEKKVSYTYLPGRLPLPTYPELEKVRKYYDVDARLNVETLTVTDLPAGEYAVSCDGKKIGYYKADQLAKGISLINRATPHQVQADLLAPVMRQFSRNMARFAMQERFRVYMGQQFSDDAKRRAYMENWYQNGLAKDKAHTRNYNVIYEMFSKEIDGKEAAIAAENERLFTRFARQGKPAETKIEITFVPPEK